MKLEVPGIINRDIPVDGQAKGEAGVGHYRRALNGYCIDSAAAGERISNEVLKAMKVLTPLRAVVIKPGRVNLRGRYGSGRIQLFGHPRVATLLHELAHHVVRDRFPLAKAHGKEFKRVFVEVFTTFGKVYKVNIVRAAEFAQIEIANEVASIKVGDIVQSIGKSTKRFKVLGVRRTRLALECVETGRGYNGNPIHLEVVA